MSVNKNLSALATLVLSMVACSPTPPYAATQSIVLTGDEAAAVRVLDRSEQREVLDAMRLAAPDHRVVRRATPAPAIYGGVRWADVEAAVAAACDDIEAAVVQTVGSGEAGEYRFRIRTIEDWPGEIIVLRVDPPDIYMVEAWIGRFSNERTDRRDKLIRAIDARMRAFGKKRKYPE